MTAIAEQDFDDLTDGTTYAPSSPWFVAGAAPTVSTAAAIHGANGLRWTSTATAGRVDYDFGSAWTTAEVLSFYFNVQTFSSANHYIACTQAVHTSGSPLSDWRINTAHTVTLRDNFSAVSTSSATLSAATDYRAEWKVDQSAATQELRIYEGEADTPIFTLSGAFSGTTTQTFTIGPYTAAAGGAIDYDTVKIADDWTGPENPPASLTPVLRRYRYNGTAWE